MKHSVLLMSMVLTTALSAQSYRLTDMSAETFANGGDAQWSFEKYTYATGMYSRLTTYTDQSTCNYLDIYQPERVGGVPITETDGVEPNGEFTWASNIRMAWCDMLFEQNIRENSLERFIYVAQDPREGFGYEAMGNDSYSSVITFTVPEDGYYKVDGTVIREDGDTWTMTLDVVPRFRYASSDNPDQVEANSTMGVAFNYGNTTGMYPDYDGNGHLAGGATQKFVAQKPTDFVMAFHAKAGDKVSFEVNTAKMKGAGGNWGHGWWSRTFYRRLDVAKVDEATAKATDNFIDAYSTSNVQALWDFIEECEIQMNEMEVGTQYGQYGAKQFDAMLLAIEEVVAAIGNGKVYALNAQAYMDHLSEAWRTLKLSQVNVEYACEGNYLLVNTDAEGVTTANLDAMASNIGEPWEFSYYDVKAGTYTLFPNHDYSSKFGSATIAAWYKGTGDWLYISDNGNIHPTTAHSPSIVFVAPETAVYKFEFSCFRANPNPTVENYMWIRSRFLKAGTTAIAKEEFIFAEKYGSVANDGEGGKAPISLNFYVSMQAGDRVTFEEDCYTANRNSSAGTQITHLAACSRVNQDSIFTVAAIKAIGADLYDPYGIGDPAVLDAAMIYADSIANAHKDNVGTNSGQYPIELYTELVDRITEARVLIEDAEILGNTQAQYEHWARELIALADRFAASRIPYEVILTGSYKINLVNTEKYITQKNSAGTHFYAALADSATIIADAEKNNVGISVYKQEFVLAQPYGTSATTIMSEDGYMTLDGYVTHSTTDTISAPTFTIYKYNADDEACCIMRSDDLYWAGAYTWKAPYDKMNTTSTPAYIFRFESTDDTAIGAPMEATVVVSIEYFTLSGVRTMSPERGIVIRRRTLDNGQLLIDKLHIK